MPGIVVSPALTAANSGSSEVAHHGSRSIDDGDQENHHEAMTRSNSDENSDNSSVEELDLPVSAIKPAASVSITGLPDRVDDDAPCCWICFDEGPDDDGAPLIRNCSCRGTSGFVHLSCVVNYAENKSREAYERGNYSAGFFKECRHCEQDYPRNVVTVNRIIKVKCNMTWQKLN